MQIFCHTYFEVPTRGDVENSVYYVALQGVIRRNCHITIDGCATYVYSQMKQQTKHILRQRQSFSATKRRAGLLLKQEERKGAGVEDWILLSALRPCARIIQLDCFGPRLFALSLNVVNGSNVVIGCSFY